MDLPSDLQAVVRSGPRPLFSTVSGAHLYGFPSPDSDVDLRGVFVLPMRDVLGLKTPKETITINQTRQGVEVDWVAHDVRKFCQLMTRRNGYVLEQLYSPLVVLGGSRHDELKSIGKGCITRPLYFHYRGFLHNQRKLLARPGATVKDLLYAYRVVLTGIKVLHSGEVEANLNVLAEEFSLPRVRELIRRKQAGGEHLALRGGEAELHATALARLEEALDTAHVDCTLPTEPTTFEELSEFVFRARMDLG